MLKCLNLEGIVKFKKSKFGLEYSLFNSCERSIKPSRLSDLKLEELSSEQLNESEHRKANSV